MSVLRIACFTAAAALLVSGCDEQAKQTAQTSAPTADSATKSPTKPAAKPQKQTRKPTTQQTATYRLSDGVQLTKQGKAMKMQAVTPVVLTFDKADFDLPQAAWSADCTLTSTTFTAKTKVDKPLNLPGYGKQTPPMTVACAVGAKTLTKAVNAVNLTTETRQAQSKMLMMGFGMIAVMAAAKQAEKFDKTPNVYGYPLKIYIDD
ncbi:hypothetical protein RXV86_14810 [Alisedimentitalea sp. MJ-SS2]|uniref:hypothetical protein n=1 Tax=Aliisedimentitalea sp. MJ-SS2 TaxID=3049795 RepID=UPI00291251A0|nr:hypothetical protein [Alisedimentitalea sp. MJ-SS2]MDU8928660.1 hypothetical protein [Alisedimentitalea sp. MJ-SS2]